MQQRNFLPYLILAFVVSCYGIAGNALKAGQWPTYRGDGRRSGYTADALPAELSGNWVYVARHGPRPAWSGRDTRMPFDRAFQPVIAGGTVFFGSSADGKVYALDAATGELRWQFFTDGPVRFAPAVWKDRLFVAGDDGFLYCLAMDDGRLLWKLRGGPDASRVLGNDQMISRWPARGGPAVADGVVYFAAGIWPSEGIFIYAVDAATGKVIWCNDDSGSITMPQPHGGAVAASGVSAQGHLVVAGDVLLVPTGRAVPAAFNRADGKLLYFHLQANRALGGSDCMALDGHFFIRGAVFGVTTGLPDRAIRAITPGASAAFSDGMVTWDRGTVRVFEWAETETKDRRGDSVPARVLKETRSTPVPYGGTALVMAGRTVVSAGAGAEGHGVALLDVGSDEPAWSTPVDGAPWGLAVADGRLVVSTDEGVIHCYGSGPKGDIRTAAEWLPYPEVSPAQKAAEEILRETGVTEGYCLDLGCGDGALAYALAYQSKLHVYAIDPDPKNVALARKNLDATGLYGARVTVHQGDLARTDYPNYFANLVVSNASLEGDLPDGAEAEIKRLMRPYGGVACLGKPGAMKKIVRGKLEGAGAWTHQYCDPANTNCSTDTLAKGPLGMLWFTDLDFQMPSRHGRGPAPLALEGRMFVEGLNGLRGVDAYNGRTLWEYPLPGVLKAYDQEHLMGTSGTGSNLCMNAEAVFVHTGDKCLRLDPATGKLLATFPAPEGPDGKPGTWGVIAVVDNTLFGTLADTGHLVTYRFGRSDMQTQFTESNLLFAMDAKSGQIKWRYRPEQSIRNNALAIGGGRVYLIDRAIALGDRSRATRAGSPEAAHPTGTLVALDAADGKPLWRTDEDVFGTVLAMSQEHDTLLMCYQDWRFKLVSEQGGRMAALEASTGKRRWDVKAAAVTRPVINGRTIIMQPGAWDLLTGEQEDFTFARSYGCGILAGSKHLLVYRSATLGYRDLTQDLGTESYGGIRPACWINTLPAAGLVLMPDGTDRCTCSYLIKASVALQPYGKRAEQPGE